MNFPERRMVDGPCARWLDKFSTVSVASVKVQLEFRIVRRLLGGGHGGVCPRALRGGRLWRVQVLDLRPLHRHLVEMDGLGGRRVLECAGGAEGSLANGEVDPVGYRLEVVELDLVQVELGGQARIRILEEVRVAVDREPTLFEDVGAEADA